MKEILESKKLITFSGLFLGYAFSRRGDIELFNASQLLLDQRMGFINTVILGGTLPFYWSNSQDHRDSKPFLYHTLIHIFYIY